MAWVRRGVISSCQALGCLATGSVAYSAVHWQLDPDASESHTVRSAVTCSFTNAGMRLFSQWSQADFRAAKKSAGAINELLLLELTREAAKTQYGKDFKLGSVTSRESFVALHPITTHEHYAPYIERVMNGETNVMFAEDVRMIAATSGTSGTQKLLPVRSKQRTVFFKHGIGLVYGTMVDTLPGFPGLQKSCKLFFTPTYTYTSTPTPIKIGPNSSTPEDSKHLMDLYSTPSACFEVLQGQ